MSFTLGTADLARAELNYPEGGVWMARCYPVEPTTVAKGARVTLTLGSAVANGTIRRGGTFNHATGILVVGGADGWARTLPRHAPYRADNGVRLSTVAADLAADTGESVVLEPGQERALGYAWTRGAGVASEALDALSGGLWWVAPDGVTHIGPHPAPVAVPGATVYSVESVQPERGWARISCPDDALGAFVTGALVPLGEGVGSMAIESASLQVSPSRVVVELWGRIG